MQLRREKQRERESEREGISSGNPTFRDVTKESVRKSRGRIVDGIRMIIKRMYGRHSQQQGYDKSGSRRIERDLEKQSSWYVRDRRKQILRDRPILSCESGWEELQQRSTSVSRRKYLEGAGIIRESRECCLATRCLYTWWKNIRNRFRAAC